MSTTASDVATGAAQPSAVARLVRLRGVRAVLWTLAGVLLALATWHVPGITPQPSLDDSWRIALHMAASQGLDFGREILFTYGPLGFLSAPLLVGGATASGSLAYAFVVQIALAVVVLVAARRTFGLPLGLVLAFLALGLPLLLSDYPVYLGFFACIWILERDEAPRWWWLSALGGALAAVALLVKLNVGLACLLLFALAVWRLPPGRLRSEGILVGSFVLSLLVLWLLTGNPLGELPDWLRHSQQVVSGYTDAMALELRSRRLQYLTAAVLLVGAAALLAPRLRPPSARSVALVLAASLYAFAHLKEGFVRHDGHDAFFFSAFAVGLLAFHWRGWARWGATALLLGAVTALLLTPENTLTSLYRPVKAADAAITSVRDVADGDRRSRLIREYRASARARLAVSPAHLRLLQGHTVDVVPDQTSAIWAYGLRWRPEPLVQWLLAYNSELDRFNAEAVGERGAERILRSRTGVVDGKVPDFEAPATYLAVLCNYRELAADSSWEVLARTPNRCGSARSLGTVRARSGETVRVPAGAPNELVYATVRFPESLLGRLQSLVFKPLRLPRVALDGVSDYRFIPATADGPLVLRTPAGAGLSPLYGGHSVETLQLRRVPSPYTIEFHAVPIVGSPWAAPKPPHSGRLERAALVVGGRRYPIREGEVSGFVDMARRGDGGAVISGWAADAPASQPADLVAVFAGERLIAEAEVTLPRPDVAAGLPAARSPDFGYEAAFASPTGEKRVRVFAIAGGEASELLYPDRYPWRR